MSGPVVEVTIVGGPKDGEVWAVQGDADGSVPAEWRIPVMGELPAAFTSEGADKPMQALPVKVLVVPILLTRDGWIADWYAGELMD